MKKNRVNILIFATAVLLSIFSSCSKENSEASSRSGRSGRVFAVVTEEIKHQTLSAYININGEVTAKTNVEVYPDIAGKVTHLSVEIGYNVKKDDIIAYVDPSKPGAAYSLSPIKSPITGTVTEIISRPGTTVETNTPIVKVGDIQNLVVYTQIPEKDVGNLFKGLKASLELPAFPGKTFEAEVTRISPVLDPVSRSKEIELSFLETDPGINSGMFPKVKLYTTEYADIIAVPSDAIITRAEKNYIFVLNKNTQKKAQASPEGKEGQNTVRRIEVKTDISTGDKTIITEGLSLGDIIVVQGMDMLSDGARVNPIEKEGSVQ